MIFLSDVFSYIRNSLVRAPRIFIVSIALVGTAIFLYSINTGFAREVPPHLLLKADKSQIVGVKKYANGDVKYAYRTDEHISTSPSENVIKEAQKKGIQVTGEDVSRRTKHSRTFTTGKENQFITEVIAGVPQYYKDGSGEWFQVEYATTTKEAFDEQTQDNFVSRIFFPSAFALSDTFWPDSDPEVTSVDGHIESSTSSSYASLHDASSINGVNDTATSDTVARNSWNGAEYTIARGFFLFDTSSLADDDIIDSATFSLYAVNDVGNDNGDYFSIVTASPASTTALSADDWDTLGTTKLATDQSFSAFATSGYVDFALNATGTSTISKTGITAFGTRSANDIANTTPLGRNWVMANFAEASGTSQDPKLVIVHEVPLIPPFGPSLKARKTVTTNSNSTTLINDDELILQLAANTTYELRGTIFASSTSATPDIKLRFGAPVGAEVNIGYVTATDDELLTGIGTTTTSGGIALPANTPVTIIFSGTIKMGANEGKLPLQWAKQNTSSAQTSVLKGSYLYTQAF